MVAWYQTKNWRWMVGSGVLLANWPVTLVAIMPTNKRLMAMSAEEAGAESRELLRRWGNVHVLRSSLGSLSAALFSWGLLTLR